MCCRLVRRKFFNSLQRVYCIKKSRSTSNYNRHCSHPHSQNLRKVTRAKQNRSHQQSIRKVKVIRPNITFVILTLICFYQEKKFELLSGSKAEIKGEWSAMQVFHRSQIRL